MMRNIFVSPESVHWSLITEAAPGVGGAEPFGKDDYDTHNILLTAVALMLQINLQIIHIQN